MTQSTKSFDSFPNLKAPPRKYHHNSHNATLTTFPTNLLLLPYPTSSSPILFARPLFLSPSPDFSRAAFSSSRRFDDMGREKKTEKELSKTRRARPLFFLSQRGRVVRLLARVFLLHWIEMRVRIVFLSLSLSLSPWIEKPLFARDPGMRARGISSLLDIYVYVYPTIVLFNFRTRAI